MSDIERTIEIIERMTSIPEDGESFNDDIVPAYRIAITALQEKLARESGCEYCTGDNPKELPGMGEDTVFLFVDRFYNGECELNWTHCPMCGRKLGGGE